MTRRFIALLLVSVFVLTTPACVKRLKIPSFKPPTSALSKTPINTSMPERFNNPGSLPGTHGSGNLGRSGPPGGAAPGSRGWAAPLPPRLTPNPGSTVPLPSPRVILVKVPALPSAGKAVNEVAGHAPEVPASPVEQLLGRAKSALDRPALSSANRVELLVILGRLDEAKNFKAVVRDALVEIDTALKSGQLPDSRRLLKLLGVIQQDAPELGRELHAALSKRFRDLKLNVDALPLSAPPSSGKQPDLALMPAPESPAGTTFGQRESVLKGLEALPEGQRTAARKAGGHSEAACRWKQEYHHTIAHSQAHLSRLSNELTLRPATAQPEAYDRQEELRLAAEENQRRRGKIAAVSRGINRKLRPSERLIVAEMNGATPEAITAMLLNLDREEGR
ncbi:MAG: hypothetical protein U0840_20905 [Gemmataceae bacterium]